MSIVGVLLSRYDNNHNDYKVPVCPKKAIEDMLAAQKNALK